MFKPTVIVIAGAYGVGKTTLAHGLSCRLNIMQRVGLGVIHRTLQVSNVDNPVILTWGDYSSCKNPSDVVAKLHAESAIVGKVIDLIVQKAYFTGESYVIDGVQLLPQHLPIDKIKYIALFLDDVDEHKSRFLSPDVTKKKHFNNATFNIVQIIQNEIIENARQAHCCTLESNLPQENLLERVIEKLELSAISKASVST